MHFKSQFFNTLPEVPYVIETLFLKSTSVQWTIDTMFYFLIKEMASVLKTLKKMLRMKSIVVQINLNYDNNNNNNKKVDETVWFLSLEIKAGFFLILVKH